MTVLTTSEITVKYVQHVGDDVTICQAAWQSTRPEKGDLSEPRLYGLLRSLLRQRHGSVFEAGFLTVSMHAPLFVLAQFVRHRHASLSIEDLSFSVESGRYREMSPTCWVPHMDRPMIPVEGFKPMRPEFVPANEEVFGRTTMAISRAYYECWRSYRQMLDDGIANEVARTVLPQGTYCHWWMSGNVRTFLSVLSLRTKDEQAAVTSHVQRETEEAGRKVEAILSERWPLTLRAWNETGRGAP